MDHATDGGARPLALSEKINPISGQLFSLNSSTKNGVGTSVETGRTKVNKTSSEQAWQCSPCLRSIV